jgi:DnaK suppressor protein
MHTLEQARLYQARQEALDELSHLRQEIQNEVDVEIDDADEQITEHETAAILIAMLERKVQDIESALASFKLGQYDICEHCSQPIKQERLVARPDARLCIACQQEVEKCCTHASTRQSSDVLSYISAFEF